MKSYLSAFAQWLCICFAFIALLIAGRIYYSGNSIYLFLVWNIFLAWLPFVISVYFKKLHTHNKIIQLFIFFTWLLFFPNALYIVTDIIHVKETELAPVWYDAILLFTSSIVGLALAFASLKNVEKYLAHYVNKKYGNLLILVLLFVGSFGVYLGRFERWNSWDVIHNPLALVQNIVDQFIYPIVNYKTWGITAMLTTLYSICWFFVKSIATKSIKINAPSEKNY